MHGVRCNIGAFFRREKSCTSSISNRILASFQVYESTPPSSDEPDFDEGLDTTHEFALSALSSELKFVSRVNSPRRNCAILLTGSRSCPELSTFYHEVVFPGFASFNATKFAFSSNMYPPSSTRVLNRNIEMYLSQGFAITHVSVRAGRRYYHSADDVPYCDSGIDINCWRSNVCELEVSRVFRRSHMHKSMIGCM